MRKTSKGGIKTIGTRKSHIIIYCEEPVTRTSNERSRPQTSIRIPAEGALKDPRLSKRGQRGYNTGS